ncbi:MAG TPA: hypothetical protein V6D12_18705 [Candidatus Obscuribacterales bacterium]
MPAIVLNVETDSCCHNPKQDGKWQSLPPCLCEEDQKYIQTSETEQQYDRLDIHLRTVPFRLPGASEILIYTPPKLDLKTIVLAKCQPFARFY